MTPLSGGQMQAMQARLDQRQAALVAAKVRELWPQRCATVPGDVLARFSQACVQDAHDARLWQDRSVVRLANLRMALGPRFPDPQAHPALAELLRQPGASEAERLTRLWVAAMARMHPRAPGQGLS
jgi:hypothetical protein